MTEWCRAVATVMAAASLALVTSACGDDDDAVARGVGEAPARDSAGSRGAELVEAEGCLTCHGPERAEGFGTSFEGLAGSERELIDGSTVIADAEYLRRSISDPDAEVVAGFDVPMPETSLSEDEVADIVAHLESL